MVVKEGYKQTEIGIIPNDWNIKSINEAFEICNNLRLPISEDVRKTMQGIYPYYGPTKIQDYINNYRVKGEFALIGEDGDHFLKWREIPMTQIAFGKFNVNNHAHLIKGKINITLTSWFYYFFNNRDITQHLTRQGAGRYKLSKSTLVKIPCVIPSTLAEQTVITNALFDADKLITGLEKLITKKRNIEQGAMQQLLQPKEGWEVRKLGEVVGKVTTGKLDANAMKENGEFRFYTCAKDYYFIDEYAFDTEALLVSGNGANVGYIHYYKGKFNAYQRTYVLTDFDIDVFYIKLFLDSYLKDRILTEVSAGNTPYIKMDTITDMTIHFPKSAEEQTRIAAILSDMDAELTALEQKLEKYKKIKLGMMQELLTGKTRLV